MREKITSYNNATVGSGTIVDETQFTYNSFAQLIVDYQAHSGAVNVATSVKVQYGYANGSANTIRPMTLTYPNGKVLTYNYSTADSREAKGSGVFFCGIPGSTSLSKLDATEWIGRIRLPTPSEAPAAIVDNNVWEQHVRRLRFQQFRGPQSGCRNVGM